jgi:hypothetical protein
VRQTSVYDDTLVKTPQGWKFKKRINWRDDDDLTPNKPKMTFGGPSPNAPDGPGAPPAGAR